MSATVPKFLIPLIIITTQQSVVSLVIPPFLHDLKYPVSAIGSLLAFAPIFALLVRLPAGMVYRPRRARALIAGALAIVALSNSLYAFAVSPIAFALVHALNGMALAAATTLHLALFVETLPPGENRRHAMGYYAGSLAVGYSTGGFSAGYIADQFGYIVTFQVGAGLTILAMALLAFIPRPAPSQTTREAPKAGPKPGVGHALRAVLDPRMATVVVVAVFLNVLHQMANAFLPLYGLAVGLSLTDVGIIRGLYSLTNAITRPLSGILATRLSAKRVMLASLPLQSACMMLVPLFHHLAPLLVVFVLIGFLRAVAIVGNTIQMVESAEEAGVNRGIASGMFNAAGDIGNILGPSAGGLIASLTGVNLLFLFGPLAFVAFFFLSLWGCNFLPSRRQF
ncbi:MAG: MFS transporter [Deltaproteobacteria bacterium]|nr:MFS transporter [Deltaproteobacteria bacterium]